MSVSPDFHRAEKTVTHRAARYGLFIVFSGPEENREWLVKNRATEEVLGNCYPNSGYGFVRGERFEFSSIGECLRRYRDAK